MNTRTLGFLPIRLTSVALAVCLGAAGYAVAGTGAPEHFFQCVQEVTSARANGANVKYVLNLVTGASSREVRRASYSYGVSGNPGRLDGALRCAAGDSGYPVCVPTVTDPLVHSFALHRMGVFLADGTLDEGAPVYVGMDCVETAQEL